MRPQHKYAVRAMNGMNDLAAAMWSKRLGDVKTLKEGMRRAAVTREAIAETTPRSQWDSRQITKDGAIHNDRHMDE